MEECRFCKFDKSKKENTVIYETQNFYVLPSLGALVDEYALVVSKKHITSLSQLSDNEKEEYNGIIDYISKQFIKFYNKQPIVFEHGTPNLLSDMKASSIVHAHAHIVNHNYINEKDIINNLNFNEIKDFKDVSNSNNYIFYINHKNRKYVTYNYDSISQIMRILIAKDLGIKDQYNWKEHDFIENINKMLKHFENDKRNA